MDTCVLTKVSIKSKKLYEKHYMVANVGTENPEETNVYIQYFIILGKKWLYSINFLPFLPISLSLNIFWVFLQFDTKNWRILIQSEFIWNVDYVLFDGKLCSRLSASVANFSMLTLKQANVK